MYPLEKNHNKLTKKFLGTSHPKNADNVQTPNSCSNHPKDLFSFTNWYESLV